MRIGISCYPTYGGSGVVATELGLKLAARGHDVHFISYAQPMRLETFRARVYFHEVEVPSYPLFEYPPYSLALASKMAETAQRQRLDLLHCHYALPHATSAFLAKQMVDRPLAVVTTLHGTDITLVGNDRSFLPITKLSIERSDALTAVSEYLRRRTVEEFGVEKPIHVVPNFIDGEEFARRPDPGCAQALKPRGERVLIHVSNFRPVKRILDVVAVFARVRAELPARLVLVGDGPDRAAAEGYARELKVADDVLFLGKQASLPPLLGCADLFLLPSDSESFGLAALEAMACEVPVVASRAGGLPEVVEHGVTGFLERVGDVEAMARDALRVLADPALRERMGRAARERALRLFEPEAVVDRYEAVYREALQAVGREA
jgi:N-acetyl-alpha-D-glucosaminyl L-malate synthase BshA